MLNDDYLKVALDDARARQTALLQLIYFTDQQAMGLLRLYVTIGLAAAAGAAAGLGPEAWLPKAVSIGLGFAAAALTIGCFFCFLTMRTAQVGLPGRGPEFWRTAMELSDLDHVVAQYLEELEAGQRRDRETNRRSGKSFERAKWAGISAPALALIAGLVTALYL